MALNNDQLQLLQQVITFGKVNNFDFENMTKETLDQLMKDWLEDGRKFYVKVMEADITTLKWLMKI